MNKPERRRTLLALVCGGIIVGSLATKLFMDLNTKEVRKVAEIKHTEVQRKKTPLDIIVERSTYQKMEVTAYTAGYESTGKVPGDAGYGVTASGTQVTQGRTIAAGKNIPFGTKIYIPYLDGREGFGEAIFTVEDRGGAIKENNIDVYMSDLTQAREFGRMPLDVYILPNDFKEEEIK